MGSVKTIIKYGCPTILLVLIAIIAAGMIPQRAYQKPPPHERKYLGTAKIVELFTWEGYNCTRYGATLDNETQIEFKNLSDYECLQVGDNVKMYYYIHPSMYPWQGIELYRNSTYIRDLIWFPLYQNDC